MDSQEVWARTKLKSQFELFSQPLPTEAELFAMWGDSDKVVASIACATFEHGDLLDDAIRSFLMQKTDFRFEIVIRDDASAGALPMIRANSNSEAHVSRPEKMAQFCLKTQAEDHIG